MVITSQMPLLTTLTGMHVREKKVSRPNDQTALYADGLVRLGWTPHPTASAIRRPIGRHLLSALVRVLGLHV